MNAILKMRKHVKAARREANGDIRVLVVADAVNDLAEELDDGMGCARGICVGMAMSILLVLIILVMVWISNIQL